MIIVIKQDASDEQVREVISYVDEQGFQTHLSRGEERTIIGVIGTQDKSALYALASLESVESLIPILKPFKLAAREMHHKPSVISVDGVNIGGDAITVIAGPCSVESEKQIITIAREVKKYGASILRGGTFKPRTSPYSFQGLEEDGLKFMKAARDETGLKIVSEIVAIGDLEMLLKYVDIIQIGARNCQNYALLKAVGQVEKPVLLKRGMSTTIKEYLQAVEYILIEGNRNVILCERGIRTFEDSTRNTLDLSGAALMKELSHLPVIVDPSHGTGVKELIVPMSRAAIAAGADGLMIEVHDHPEKAYSDGPQSLKPDEFAECMQEITKIAGVMKRKM